MLATVAFCGLIAASAATSGTDVSQATGIDAFKCLKENGYTFTVIRCYESVGRVDSNCPHTIYNAWDGGMSDVDIYFFPDPSANNAATQMSDMVKYLESYNVKSRGPKPGSFGMVWLDIEGSQYWHSSQTENRDFFTALANEAESLGLHVGVYTSESQWTPIMGSWTGGSKYPLWYAHYDGEPSFSDFRAFGGWTKPSIKQYAGDRTICGAGVDVNWY